MVVVRATSNEQRYMVFCRWVSQSDDRSYQTISRVTSRSVLQIESIHKELESDSVQLHHVQSIFIDIHQWYVVWHVHMLPITGVPQWQAGRLVEPYPLAQPAPRSNSHFWNSLSTDGWWLFVMLCYCCYPTLDQAHMCSTEGLQVYSLPVLSPGNFNSTYNWIYLKLHLTPSVYGFDRQDVITKYIHYFLLDLDQESLGASVVWWFAPERSRSNFNRFNGFNRYVMS